MRSKHGRPTILAVDYLEMKTLWTPVLRDRLGVPRVHPDDFVLDASNPTSINTRTAI